MNVSREIIRDKTLTMAIMGPLESSEMSRRLISCIDALRGIQIESPHRSGIVLHSTHDTTEHRQVYPISVDIAVSLFVSVRGGRTGLPNFERDAAEGLVKCR